MGNGKSGHKLSKFEYEETNLLVFPFFMLPFSKLFKCWVSVSNAYKFVMKISRPLSTYIQVRKHYKWYVLLVLGPAEHL